MPSLEWQKSAWLELHEHENANCTSTKVVDLDALPSEGGFMHGKKVANTELICPSEP